MTELFEKQKLESKNCATCGKELTNEYYEIYDKISKQWIKFCSNDNCIKNYNEPHKFKIGCIHVKLCHICGERIGMSDKYVLRDKKTKLQKYFCGDDCLNKHFVKQLEEQNQ